MGPTACDSRATGSARAPNTPAGDSLQEIPTCRTAHQGLCSASEKLAHDLAHGIRPGMNVVTSRGKRGFVHHQHQTKPGVWLIRIKKGRTAAAHHWVHERFLTPVEG